MFLFTYNNTVVSVTHINNVNCKCKYLVSCGMYETNSIFIREYSALLYNYCTVNYIYLQLNATRVVVIVPCTLLKYEINLLFEFKNSSMRPPDR